MTLPESRKVTHQMAREAWHKMHDALYCGKSVPTLTIPRSLDDVDMILADYFDQQEELEHIPVDDSRRS